MNLNDVMKCLDGIAPVALSDEFCKKDGLYDNSGVIIKCSDEVNGALFSLDLSINSVREAKLRGYNLIVTHHPAIYGGISRIDATSDPQSKALAECIKNGISVISMHLNFDAAQRGIDYHLMRGLGGKNAILLTELSNGGYGRVYDISPTLFSEYVEKIKNEFSTHRILTYGNERKIGKVASFCGAGCDDKSIMFAVEHNADLFVSADMKHHEIAKLLGYGKNILVLTHYASETYGFSKIYSEISARLSVPNSFYCDKELI